jgi:hypothetical protein
MQKNDQKNVIETMSHSELEAVNGALEGNFAGFVGPVTFRDPKTGKLITIGACPKGAMC